jgi:predicted phage terminase large subunit-like protein
LRDLTGQVIKASQTRGGDDWEVIELPAIMPSGKPVWPEFWKLEELLALKEELPVGKWNAQYQQQPTAEEGAIVKREWWKVWEGDRPPPCDFVIQSWDTAFLKHNRADFSACTTWGVWTTEEGETNIILLDAFKDRYEFPELKQKAYETYREWEPDVFLVEAKAAGSPLVFELRRMGIPVSEYSPTKGNDKIVRLNAVSDLFASGRIWVPERKFADELIEEVAAFPSGEHDDLVDSMTQALLRFRTGGFLSLQSDDEDREPIYRRKVAYY